MIAFTMISFEYGGCGRTRVLTMMSSNKDVLVVRPLQENEACTVISHTWGDKHRIEGIEWDVPSWMSLGSCKALVERYNAVWIDSVCIKQDDEEDVKRQIENMHSIYWNKEVVVVLAGKYSAQLKALRCIATLLKQLGRVRACTDASLSRCRYLRLWEKMRKPAETARGMQWFRRVWTLQEGVLAKQLTFVGFKNEGRDLETDVTSKEKLQRLCGIWDDASIIGKHQWDDINHFEERVPKAGSKHSCTLGNTEYQSVVAAVGNIVHCIQNIFIKWPEDCVKREQVIAKLIRMLGSSDRKCQKEEDLVYGVRALLNINIPVKDRPFENVFYEALQQLVGRELFVLPHMPRQMHGFTWLPCLDGIKEGDAWKTVRNWEPHHILTCTDTHIVAKGRLTQFCRPCVIRSSLKSVDLALKAIDRYVKMDQDNDVNWDDVSVTIALIVLWVTISSKSTKSLHGFKSLIAMLTESWKHDTACDRGRIHLQLLEQLQGDFPNLDKSVNKLEDCGMVWNAKSVYGHVPCLDSFDAVAVCEKNVGLVLFSAPSSIQNMNTYGVFDRREIRYENNHGIRFIYSTVLARDKELGIWDNHGRARFCSVFEGIIPETKVPVGESLSLQKFPLILQEALDNSAQ